MNLKNLNRHTWLKGFVPYYAEGDPPPPPPPPPPPVVPPPPELKYTEDQYNAKLNAVLAEDRRKHKAQVEAAIKDLESVRESANLTQKQRDELQVRIEEMNNQLLTKDELAKKEKEKLEKQHQEQLGVERTTRERYQNLFTTTVIEHEILKQAAVADAWRSDQLVSLLKDKTHLVEDVDEHGKGIGTFTPKVKFPDKDKDGKPIALDLTVEQAIKRMKDLPEVYGNLFKSGVTGGLGGTGSVTSPRTPVDLSVLTKDPAAYRKWRRENPDLDLSKVGRR